MQRSEAARDERLTLELHPLAEPRRAIRNVLGTYQLPELDAGSYRWVLKTGPDAEHLDDTGIGGEVTVLAGQHVTLEIRR